MGRVTTILGNPEVNSGLWLAIAVCLLVLLLLTWLILRRHKLLCSKVNEQVDTLNAICHKIGSIEEKAVGSFTPRAQGIKDEEQLEVNEDNGQIPERSEEAYFMSKTGKIHTEEELDELIKD